jgi:hypothetical protein
MLVGDIIRGPILPRRGVLNVQHRPSIYILLGLWRDKKDGISCCPRLPWAIGADARDRIFSRPTKIAAGSTPFRIAELSMRSDTIVDAVGTPNIRRLRKTLFDEWEILRAHFIPWFKQKF